MRFLIFALVLGTIVLVVLGVMARPLLANTVYGFAQDNPALLRFPFVADVVREKLGPDLATPASEDPSQLEFVVQEGDTASSIARRLADSGLLRNPLAFVFIATERGLTGQLQAGSFLLRRNMAPAALVTTLLEARDTSIQVALRQGLRIEQVVAYLQTLPLQLDAEDFLKLVQEPPAELLADYPWLELPKGASLEGYLAGGFYRVLPDTTPDELVRRMLDRFYEQVGPQRLSVPASRGMTFREILTLASLVQKEAALTEEMPTIAGVYQNRLDRDMLLQADPTVIYGNDTVQLRKLPIDAWPEFSFWNVPRTPMANVELPPDLRSYQTYQVKGLMDGPIGSPTVDAIDAALSPDTESGYLFFVAKGDGSKSHAFARTLKEHEANLRKYGYK